MTAGVPAVTWCRTDLMNSSCTAFPEQPATSCPGASAGAAMNSGVHLPFHLPVPLALAPQSGPQSQQLSWRPRSLSPVPVFQPAPSHSYLADLSPISLGRRLPR